MRAIGIAIIIIAISLGIFCVLLTSTPPFKPLELDFFSRPYADDTYQIYSLMINQFGDDTPIIQEQTVTEDLSEGCLTTYAAFRFRGAVADYKRLNKTPWLLKRNFQLGKPYELVSSSSVFAAKGDLQEDWDNFYKRFPHSGGLIQMSAVGFNQEKTRAIVYFGSSRNSNAGYWIFRLFEKIHGKWEEVPGATCSVMA